MGQHASTQRTQRRRDSENPFFFSRWNQTSQIDTTPSLEQPVQSPPSVPTAMPSPPPSHLQAPSSQPFATFSRHISAASTSAVREGSSEREHTVGRQGAIFYEQQEERRLVHMDDLGMRNAPITHITASPMPRRSRFSRLSSIILPRGTDSGRAHNHLDVGDHHQGSLHRDSLEIARESQRRRSRRSSYYRAQSPEATVSLGHGRRRRNASISGPYPLGGNSTVPSSFLAVSSQTDAIRRRELQVSIEGSHHLTGYGNPAPSRLARFRRSISSSLEAHTSVRRSRTHDHATQTPPRQSTGNSFSNDSVSLSSPMIEEPRPTFTEMMNSDPVTGQGTRRISPRNLRENIEASPIVTRGSVWNDPWSEPSTVGRRESRRVPSVLGGRSTRLIRRDHDGSLPRILNLAAFAIAAQLSGSTEQTASNLQANGPDDLDGNFSSFFRALQTNPHRATGDSDMEEGASRMGRLARPTSPLNYLRVFRFVNDATTAEAHSDLLTRERSDESAGATASPATTETRSENSEGRTVTLVVVGVRSVASDEPSTEPGLNPLLEFPPISPASTFLSGGAGGMLRGVNGTSRLGHRRRASSGGISTFPANYDSQRHQSMLSTNRPSSIHTAPVSGSVTPSGVATAPLSDSPAGPHPPPSTPAEPGLSTYSSQTTTPSRRPSSASATQQSQTSFQEVATSQARDVAPIIEGQEQPVRRVQYRRRSDAEFARHGDLGAGAARRNGVVAPDDDDAAAPAATRTRSWLIYVVGTNLTQDHPALAAPSLFTDSPSYEDMLLLSSLLGPAKPPVADSEDVEAAGGLFCVDEGPGYLAAKSKQGNDVLHIATGERCLVCLEEYQPQKEVRRLNKCLHIFHRECIDEWLTTGRNSCPLCRGEGVPDKKDNPEFQSGT